MSSLPTGEGVRPAGAHPLALRVRARPELANHPAVHFHPALLHQFLGRAAGGDPGARENLLEAFSHGSDASAATSSSPAAGPASRSPETTISPPPGRASSIPSGNSRC